MKTFLKFFYSILALILVLTIFSACSNVSDKKNENQENSDMSTDVSNANESINEDIERHYTYKHVILIGLDGAGRFFRDTDTPNIDRIFANGAVTYDMLTSNPSISAQSWGSMLTGVIPEIHHFNNINIGEKENTTIPTVFRVVKEQKPESVVASFCNWGAINFGIVENNLDIYKESVSDDDAISAKAAEYIVENKPTLLFLHLGSPDDAGHAHKYGKKEHLESITICDGYVERLYEACSEAGILDDTLFMVTADHGGEDVSHGGWLDQEKYVMFAATGKTVIPGGTIQDMGTRDTTAIILYALGLEDYLPEASTARVPGDLFEGVDATERKQDVFSYDLAYRTHESEPTPDIGSGNSVVDAIGADRFYAYFTFDRTIDDALNNVSTEANGKLYHPLGFYGDGCEFDDGYISVDGFEPELDSFSVGFWMKVMSNSQDPVILGNQSHASSANPGFILGFKYDWLDFRAGNKKTYTDNRGTIPEDYHDAWTYAVMVVDRENARIGFSFDFGEFEYSDIAPELVNTSFSNNKKLSIGQDGSGKFTYKTPGIYDEMILVKGVLTDDDISALKNCYVH